VGPITCPLSLVSVPMTNHDQKAPDDHGYTMLHCSMFKHAARARTIADVGAFAVHGTIVARHSKYEDEYTDGRTRTYFCNTLFNVSSDKPIGDAILNCWVNWNKESFCLYVMRLYRPVL